MNDFIQRTRILVLATHSEAMIRGVCNCGALLEQGRVIAFGAIDDVLREYASRQKEAAVETPAAEPTTVEPDMPPADVPQTALISD